MILGICITWFVVLCVVGYIAYVQAIKAAKLQSYLELYTRMLMVTAIHAKKARKRMEEVDRLGSFEADDETGFIFQEIKDATIELDDFISKYITSEEDENDKDEKEENE